MSVQFPASPCQYRWVQASSGSTHGSRPVAALLGGSLTLTIALFADGFAFFAWDGAAVLWLGCVAFVGAFAGHWLLRTAPASVLAVLAGAVALLHLVRAAGSSL